MGPWSLIALTYAGSSGKASYVCRTPLHCASQDLAERDSYWHLPGELLCPTNVDECTGVGLWSLDRHTGYVFGSYRGSF